MKKLTYKKIADSVITIDLQNNYSIIALSTYKHEESRYLVSLQLKHNELDIITTMDDFENVGFSAIPKTINSAILKYVASLLQDNKFEIYQRRYEYLLKCFDIGNELFEKERMNMEK